MVGSGGGIVGGGDGGNTAAGAQAGQTRAAIAGHLKQRKNSIKYVYVRLTRMSEQMNDVSID